VRTLIVGNGGRESALARAMAADSELCAVVAHRNPSIVAQVEASGGALLVGDVCDGAAIADFAAAEGVELAMVSADEPLAAGVVDALLGRGIASVGPTAAGAEIEWNKVYARELLAEVAPSSVPRLRIARGDAEARAAIDAFGDAPVAVKPAGLTGGKGVKVMGPHLADHAAALDYALSLLAAGGAGSAVLVEEKIEGPEFTIQAISDGRSVVLPPATYDFPYRYDGDSGPGTGGMGSLSLASRTLPFMTGRHYEEAGAIIEAVIARLGADGRHFSGVMNSGFFATADGVKVIEFNARFGDPECMNIMALLRGSWTDAMRAIADRRLRAADVPLADAASLVLYLVSPDYALGRGGAPIEFDLDLAACEARGVTVHFSSTVEVGPGRYRTVGTSRALALTTSGPTLAECRERLVACAQGVPQLEWRADIGTDAYLESLGMPPAAAS
jgi:phosphoribosylamine--glycine ligase